MSEYRNRTRQGTDPMTQQLPDLSFTAFHQMNRPRYIHYAETFLHNRHDAEEAIDSAFEQLLRTWDKVLLVENPSGYAWTVMRNKVNDHSRARRRRPRCSTTRPSTPSPCATPWIRTDRSPSPSPS